MKLYSRKSKDFACNLKNRLYNTDITSKKEREKEMNVGDFVFAEYDNGEIVNGEIVTVRMFGDRMLLTVKAEQGYRSIYTDKCVTLDTMEAAK